MLKLTFESGFEWTIHKFCNNSMLIIIDIDSKIKFKLTSPFMIKDMSLYYLKMVKRRDLVVLTVNKIRIEVTWCDRSWHFPWNLKIMFIQYKHINFVKQRDTTGNNDVIWNSKFILCQKIQHIWYDIWPFIFIDTKFSNFRTVSLHETVKVRHALDTLPV